MKINNYFKSIAIVLLILLSLSSLHSQSLKKLGAGLNEPVLSACSDSIGNIYAVSHKGASDSLKIYKFDVNSGTWSLFAAKKDGKYHALPVSIQSSFTIRNNVYVNYMIDSMRFEMYEVNQIYKNGLNKLGEWVRPTGNYSKSKALSKTKVRVNENNTFTIQIDGYGESKELSNEEFIRDMNKIMEH